MSSQHSSCLSASNASLTAQESLRNLAPQIVAYHFCQSDNNLTCMVPEFIHSIAAYLSKAPQLSAYRDYMLLEPSLQNHLSVRECIQNPSQSLMKGILEPLKLLKNAGKIDSDSCLILVDSLNEAEFHKPDYGDTIASFLARHIHKFPSWLKVIVTVQTAMLDIVKQLPFQRVILDKAIANDISQRDLGDYINYRMNNSVNLRNNIALNGKLDTATQLKFSGHLQTLSKGSFLFCTLTLDLIEKGHLVLKSTNYKILPVSVPELFLLHFNLKFPSVRSFEKVSPILGASLASLYPLTTEEIFETMNSGYTQRYVSLEECQNRLQILSGCLHLRRDRTYVFFHPAFREWLIRRDESDNNKFLCDIR